MPAAYLLFWELEAGVSSRHVLALVSSWWAALYISLFLRLTIRETAAIAAAALCTTLWLYVLHIDEAAGMPWSYSVLYLTLIPLVEVSPVLVDLGIRWSVRRLAAIGPDVARVVLPGKEE